MAVNPVPPSAGIPEPATLLKAYREPAVLLDPEYRIVATNRAYQETYGMPESTAGRHC